ncbi:hypothetical protein [Bradyrhizobium sp. URHC0002]
MNLEPDPATNDQHRVQAGETGSAIRGIVRKIIHVMLVIVALAVIWQ